MKTGIAAGLAGLLASGVVLAQAPEEGSGEHRGGPQKRGGGPEKSDFFGDMLRRSDTDKNGGISFVEFAAGKRVSALPAEHQKRLFDRLDKNKDGEIRRDEIGRPSGRDRGNPERGSKQRGPHDPDGDGRVSLEEFRKSPRVAGLDAARQEELFARMDRNGDGFLDRKDYQGRRPGRDGEGPSRMVEELDADKDGMVSFEEFRAGSRAKGLNEAQAKDMFERMDRNQDGKLGADDFRGERRGPGMGPDGSGKSPRGRGTGPDGTKRGKDPRSPHPQRPAKPDGDQPRP